MRFLRPSSENEMVAVFLRGELGSERFAPGIREAIRAAREGENLIIDPDLTSPEDNAVRRRVLDATRGYEQRIGLFDGFPHDVQWSRVALMPVELGAVRYINWSYWLEISGGTRRPADAAGRIRSGVKAYGVANDGFHELADELRQGRVWSELIVVSAHEQGGDVVLEGHGRLTGMALAADALPEETEVLRGVSPLMTKWSEY